MAKNRRTRSTNRSARLRNLKSEQTPEDPVSYQMRRARVLKVLTEAVQQIRRRGRPSSEKEEFQDAA